MSEYKIIHKSEEDKGHSNLRNYDNTYNSFSWKDAEKLFNGLPKNQGLNIAHEAIDCHALNDELTHKIAVRFIRQNGTIQDFSYYRLRKHSNQFANTLKQLEVLKGERVFCLAPRIPELYISLFGALKNLNVFCPLFSAFGPEPIKSRMIKGDAKVLITTESLYIKKIQQIQHEIPSLKYVILIADGPNRGRHQHTLWFDELVENTSDNFTIPPTNPQDMALIHFTSGTTGSPKGAIHAHRAVMVHAISGKFALDCRVLH